MAASDSVVFHQSDLLSGYVSIFREMRKTGELCDVLIKAGDKSFAVHRVVLAAGIPYFRAMFSSDMLERTALEITINEIDPRALESFISFAYSSKIKITKENVEILMVASAFLQVGRVRDACCEFISERIDSKNVLNIRHLADTLSNMTLLEISDRYIGENFDEVSASEEFLRLPFKFLRDLIQRDDLAVTQEEEVYEAVMRWVKSSDEERHIFLPELLRGVRMMLLSPDYLIKRVNSENLIRTSPPCRDLLDEVKNYHLLPENGSNCHSFLIQPRKKSVLKYVSLANNGSEGLYAACYSKSVGRFIKYFDLGKEAWYTLSAGSQSKRFCSILAEGNRIYAIGEKEIEMFNFGTQQWVILGAINNTFSRTAVVLFDEKIFFFCGDFVSSDKVRCFDLQTKTWLNEGRTKIRRASPAVVTLEGSIYILGDYSNNGFPFSVEKYSPRTGRSTEVSPMLCSRCGHAAAAVNGKIYACGGRLGRILETAEVYDLETNQWSIISQMIVPRCNFSLVACNGKLYAIGGRTEKGNTPSVEVYDPEANEWSFGVSVSSMSEYPACIRAFSLSPVCG